MFFKEVSVDVVPPVLPDIGVIILGRVGDGDGLPQGGASVYRLPSPCSSLMVASLCTVIRRWWRSSRTVPLSVGLLTQGRAY